MQRCPASAPVIVVNDESLPQVILSWRDYSIMTRRRHVDYVFANSYCAMLKIWLNRAMIRRGADPASNEAAGGSCTGKNLRHHSAHGFDIFILTLLDILTQRATIPLASRSAIAVS